MTYGLRILAQADADVDAAAHFIAQDSMEAALRFYDAVTAAFQLIRENPLLCQRYELPYPGQETLRKSSIAGFREYLIFYRLDADMVEVIRVLHGSRDIPRILDESTN